MTDSTLPLDAERPLLGLFVLGPGLEIEVVLGERAMWTLGRARDNDIVIDHASVSRHHARLHARGGFALEALAATNPVRFGNRQLAPGDLVAVAPGEAFVLGALVGVIRPAATAGGPLPGVASAPAPAAIAPPRALREVLIDEERRRIIEALRRCAGNQSRAAELLRMPRRTLVKRLREYGIPRGRVIPDRDS